MAERSIVILTADAPTERCLVAEAKRRGWRPSVMRSPPEEPRPGGEIDILLADLRPLSRNAGLVNCVPRLAGLHGAPRRFRHGIGIGVSREESGRYGIIPLGLTRYVRVTQQGVELERQVLDRLFAEIEALSAEPPYRIVDFHAHLPSPTFHHDIVESLSIPLAVVDSDDRLIFLNLNALALFDYVPYELFRQPWEVLVAPESRGLIEGFTFRVRHSLRAEIEIELITRTGRLFPGLISASRVFSPVGEGNTMVLQFRDISRTRFLESQVVELQKVESIARLARGIAHDFNNTLGTALGFASLARDALGEHHPVTPDIDRVIEATEQAARLTSKLLDMGRGGKYVIETFDLAHVVEEALDLCRTSLHSGIRLELDLQPARLRGDRRQWRQVVTNLVLNAVEACRSGSKIRLSTAEVSAAQLGNTFFRRHPDLEPRLTVRLEVADTGRGMAPEIRRRVFEPFFTTSSEHRGLGLAVVEGIVSNHQGVVEIDSLRGRGTTVSIYVPAALEAVRQYQEQVAAEVGTKTPKRVLVVDDEGLLREIADRFLRRLGYRTVLADGGQEAIAVVEQDPEGIDIVLLDLLMPGMSGQEVAEYLLEKHPDLPILLVSGYVEQELVENLLASGVRGFLAKPYDIETLARRLREVEWVR